jgi:hypothetical protein
MWPFSTIKRLRAALSEARGSVSLLERRTIWMEKCLAGDQKKIAELMRRIEVLQGRKI